MKRVDYLEILSDIPCGDEFDYFESEMKIAERDYFYKKETFIKGIRLEIQNLKKEIISNILNDIKENESELELWITKDYKFIFNFLYIDSLLLSEIHTKKYYERKLKKQLDDYQYRKLLNIRYSLYELYKNKAKKIYILNYWLSVIDELEKIYLK